MRKKRDIDSEGRLKNRVTFKFHRQPLDSLLVSEAKLKEEKIRLTEAEIRLLNAKTIAVIVSTILGISTFIITVVLPQFSNKRYRQLHEMFEDK